MALARTDRHNWPLASGPCSPTLQLLACCPLVNGPAPRICPGPGSSRLLSLLVTSFLAALNSVLRPLSAFARLKSGHIHHLDHGSHSLTSYWFDYCKIPPVGVTGFSKLYTGVNHCPLTSGKTFQALYIAYLALCDLALFPQILLSTIRNHFRVLKTNLDSSLFAVPSKVLCLVP